MANLEEIVVGSNVSGIVSSESVQIVAVRWYGSAVLEITYKTNQGALSSQLLYREDEARLSVQENSMRWSFDAKGDVVRLASEAYRIHLAHLFDPYLAVDMFNEGVDVPSVDMVLFLRPTESPVVFLQQLGRGLRRDRGKEYLNVLDFIGNYEKAGNVRFYLSGNRQSGRKYDPADRSWLPDDCIVDFDLRLIDLFKKMDQKQIRIRDLIHSEYQRVKELLGRRPMRMDLFTYMDEDIYQLAIKNPKENPFKRYLEYLSELGELTEDESRLFRGIGREFINLIENTNMTKVYKMPVLMAFYNHGDILTEVSEEQLLDAWKEFFSTGTNWKDLDKDMTYEKYRAISDREHIKKIIQMPVHFLQESGKGFFVSRAGVPIALCDEMKDVVQDVVFTAHFQDVIEYRAMDYYKRRYDSVVS